MRLGFGERGPCYLLPTLTCFRFPGQDYRQNAPGLLKPVRFPNIELPPPGAIDRSLTLTHSVSVFFEPPSTECRCLTVNDTPSPSLLSHTPPLPLLEEEMTDSDPDQELAEESDGGEILVIEPETADETAV
jgi:hypothetical protein